MKTMSFGTFHIMPTTEGSALLVAYSPSHGHFEMSLTADELGLLQVEIGNTLQEARGVEQTLQEEQDLQKEQRR